MLFLGAATCFGCASAQLPDSDTRTYVASFETVVEAVSDAYLESGLEIERGTASDDGQVFTVLGFRRSRAFGATTRVAEVGTYITRISDLETQVRVETTERDVPAAASSANRPVNETRKLFAILAGKLNQVQPH